MASEDHSHTNPALEERFLQPVGWRWHMFAGHNGEKLRFGSVFPKHVVPKAVIVILPGRAEYCEKYFELIRGCLEKKYAVYILEWQGQGRSHRHIEKSPHKNISNGFYKDVQDLEIFIRDYVLPSGMHPEVGKLPLAMLAHSMGGNIGLRYLSKHPSVFSCAAMTTPMFGIHALDLIPGFLRIPLTKLLMEVADCSYVPGGTGYAPREKNFFSSDPHRDAIHDAWMQFDPKLQIGDVTYRWLYHATKTCHIVQQEKFLKSIKTPLLLALAGREKLVSNKAIRRAAHVIRGAILKTYPEAGHEILMECDSIRDDFLKSFDDLIKINILDKKKQIITPEHSGK
ncbi:MAG: alpha/beta hydrolase [Rhodospirillales bacterium]|nr:alpha/beta hydrolase [Rhodospirillales bacterium]